MGTRLLCARHRQQGGASPDPHADHSPPERRLLCSQVRPTGPSHHPALMSGGTPAPKPKPDILVLQPRLPSGLLSVRGAEPARRSEEPAEPRSSRPAVPLLAPQSHILRANRTALGPGRTYPRHQPVAPGQRPASGGAGAEHLLLVVTCRSFQTCASTHPGRDPPVCTHVSRCTCVPGPRPHTHGASSMQPT